MYHHECSEQQGYGHNRIYSFSLLKVAMLDENGYGGARHDCVATKNC